MVRRDIALLLSLEVLHAAGREAELLTQAPRQCADVERTPRCRARKRADDCDRPGCDLTCGKCNVPDGWQKSRARWFPVREYKRLVATGDWWLSYGHAEGAYATVVVPTICKRLDRLTLLVQRLSSEMQCVKEVMVVARSPCTNLVTNALRNADQAKLRRKNVTHTVVDMGGWDAMYGPASRFLAARNARGTTLVHLDDDELPCERQVCGVAAAALKEPMGIYGHHKRRCSAEKGYHTAGDPRRERNWNSFNVLLTLFAATSRAFNDMFVRHFDRYALGLASVKGNGEDIAYSHFLLRYFNTTPTYVPRAPCYAWSVNGSLVESYRDGFSHLNDETGISANQDVHYIARRVICRRYWNRSQWDGRIKGRKEKDLVLVPHGSAKVNMWTVEPGEANGTLDRSPLVS